MLFFAFCHIVRYTCVGRGNDMDIIKKLLIITFFVYGVLFAVHMSHAQQNSTKETVVAFEKNIIKTVSAIEQRTEIAKKCWQDVWTDFQKAKKNMAYIIREGRKNVFYFKAKIQSVKEALVKKKEFFQDFFKDFQLSQKHADHFLKETFQRM